MKIIGRDVTVYQWEIYGIDSPGQRNVAGAVSNLIGRWETIEVNMEKEWADHTSADAEQPEMRKTIQKWDATCKGQVDSGGSQAIEGFLSSDYMVILFTDIVSNRSMVLRGGIRKAGANWEREKVGDTLELLDVGREPFGGLATLQYVTA